MIDDRFPNPFARIPHHACICGHSWDMHTKVMTHLDVAYNCQVEWPNGKFVGQLRYCTCTEYRPNRLTPLEMPEMS
jgi:hypothetical protein